MRDDAQGGRGAQRSIGGECQVLCTKSDAGYIGMADTDNTFILGMSVNVGASYQRCFVSLTIAVLRMTHDDQSPGRTVVELCSHSATSAFARAVAPDGTGVAMTGVIDLPAGESWIFALGYPEDYEGWGSYSGAGLQVILGQTVTSPGCQQRGGGG